MAIIFWGEGWAAITTKKKNPTQPDPKKLFLAQKKIAQPPPPFLKNNGYFLNRALTLTESKGKWIISSSNP